MTAILTPVRHRFVLELHHDGECVHALPLERADFARAVEATFFESLRRGLYRDYDPPLERAALEPALEPGSPHAATFEVVLPLSSGGEQRGRFTGEFFKNLARRTGAQLAVAGRVPADATLQYRLAAFADEPPVGRKAGFAFDLESEQPAIPIRSASRKRHGPVEAWDSPRPDDFPVLVPRHVLEESVEEARKAPSREVGGVLLGHLCRDEETGELFLEVSCLVPAEETEATALSVTFTHRTWARVREVMQWRGEGELVVGWMHSHPFRLCDECPLPVPPECQAKVLFYSSDDEFLMELSFPRPFMVGLLAAVEPKLERTLGHLPVKLFGWDGGLIRPRGFEVIE
jgi:proteasome lid subunit RPN8/RPN11